MSILTLKLNMGVPWCAYAPFVQRHDKGAGMRNVALMILVLALVLTACSTGTPTHHATVAQTTAHPSPSTDASASAVSQPLTCGTDVGTSQANTPLSVAQVIGNLVAVFAKLGFDGLSDSGLLSSREISVLIAAALDLHGHSGNKLSDDAAAFSQAERGYNPGPLPREDLSYGADVGKTIVDLAADCPKSYKIAQTLPG